MSKEVVHYDYKNDDLNDCLTYNSPTNFNANDISGIVAEVAGANDEFNWWWIIKLKNKKYILLSAGCDYTGWDCQSWIRREEIYNTALKAAKASPLKEEYANRNIQKNLILQIKGKQPYGLYDSKHEVKDNPKKENE